ncbi:MAG: dTMP kinase [Candidatus Rokubacteria bacterium GWC2_70_16]|nr:MAG: dTMP kinase [Candidatus Rokubacteria bacterium GWC2_70_16]OGL19177.1 MAG: dTMP kinase [Candidatus Rokubacteria bacterium RIFCSPLOWO2_12_FULL_71_19]
MRGALITFEGVEGSGKTTQCARLAEHLQRLGRHVVPTSEPDGTALGMAIRALFEEEGTPPTPLAQVFLFMAARQQHVAQVIRPALAQGAVVLSDRYADATLAYQGYAQGLDLQTIRDLNALATGGVLPDLTLVLDLEPGAGMRRLSGRRLDAFERMDLGFHQRVREGYLEIARAEKNRVMVFTADRGPEALHAEIARVVEARLGRLEGSRPR